MGLIAKQSGHHILNIIEIDLQLYKIFEITRVSFFDTVYKRFQDQYLETRHNVQEVNYNGLTSCMSDYFLPSYSTGSTAQGHFFGKANSYFTNKWQYLGNGTSHKHSYNDDQQSFLCVVLNSAIADDSFQATVSIENLPTSGRPQLMSARDKRSLIRSVKNNRSTPLKEITTKFNANRNRTVSKRMC